MSHVNVRINGRVLWIGGDAYPLQNVVRAARVKGKPGGINDQLSRVGCLVVLLVVMMGFLSMVLWTVHKYALAIAPWALAGLALVSGLVVRMVKGPVYSLVIETSGSTVTVLSSRDRDHLDGLAWEIMSAIDNLGAEYPGPSGSPPWPRTHRAGRTPR